MITLVWVVGMINAFNLLDNMDGLCGGIALIVGTALLLQLSPVEPGSDAFFKAQYLALLVGATAGFLVYNVYPASIFLGDSGSLLLGASFAALTLAPVRQAAASSNPLSIVSVPLLVLLIPIFDTALVTASRVLSGKSPATGGRDHSSHRLVAVGLSERAAVAVLWGLAAIGGSLGLAFQVNYLAGILAAGAAGFYLCWIWNSQPLDVLARRYIRDGAFMVLGFLAAWLVALLPVFFWGDVREYFTLQLTYLTGYESPATAATVMTRFSTAAQRRAREKLGVSRGSRSFISTSGFPPP